MKKDVGEFTTEAKADEVYETKHSFEVDSLKGLELFVEVYDEKLAEHTVSASVTGAKALGNTSKLLLGSCKINLDKHGITDDPKGVKCPPDHMVTNARKVLDPSTSDEHDRVFLKIMSNTGDVTGHFNSVR